MPPVLSAGRNLPRSYRQTDPFELRLTWGGSTGQDPLQKEKKKNYNSVLFLFQEHAFQIPPPLKMPSLFSSAEVGTSSSERTFSSLEHGLDMGITAKGH